MRVMVGTPVKDVYSYSFYHIVKQNFKHPYESVLLISHPEHLTNPIDIVLHKYRRLRDLFLASDCDALLTVEDDIVIPSNTISLLSETEGDVIYGVYAWRERDFMHHWNVSTDRSYQGNSICLDKDKVNEVWGKATDKYYPLGFGCTLIHRRVLETLDFRTEGMHFPDFYFALDCLERGFKSVAHFGVICGHFTRDYGDLRIVVPNKEHGVVFGILDN